MGVELRGKVYYAFFEFRGQRYHPCLDTSNYAEAMRREKEKKAIVRATGGTGTNAGWMAYKDAYYKWAIVKNPRTVAIEKRALFYLDEYFRAKKADDITPAVLDGLKADMKAKGKGVAVINRTIRAIKFIMRWGEKRNLRSKADWINVTKFREPKGTIDFLTVDELAEVLKAAQKWPQMDALARLGARHGLRIAEAYNLYKTDFDFTLRRINICAKDDWHPKNYESRFVPMDEDSVPAFKAAAALSKTKYLIAEGTWRPASAEAMATEFKDRVLKAAGITRGRFHILRHTYASHLAMAGVTPWQLQKLLGHANLTTTQIYAHLSKDSIQDAAALLPKIPRL